MFGLRESTLLNTITVKMSVLLGCQHGVYAMSFAASMTSYYIHYVMKRFTSVIYMWTLYRYVSLKDYLEVCSFQLVLVLLFYCVLTCLHDVKTKKHSHTTCFYFLEYDVISQLRHNYTKDLFCVTWFKHFTNIEQIITCIYSVWFHKSYRKEYDELSLCKMFT